MAVVTTPGILLRSYAYGETSRILRFFTLDGGLVGVVAKGVRKEGSRSGSGLESFAEGTLTFYHKAHRDLQTYKSFAPGKPRRALARDLTRFAGASVLCELVLKHAAEEPAPALYAALVDGFDAITRAATEGLRAAVLASGWRLVAVLGYRPILDHCVSCGQSLGEEEVARFDFGAGGVRCAACGGEGGGPRVGPRARAQLQELVQGLPPETLLLPGAHLRLLDDFVTYHVSGGRPLKSFALLHERFPHDEAEG